MAQQLLNAFGGGIAAPSANRYGRLSPTKPEHVRDELGEAVHVLLDGGDSPIGLESTIVSCLNNEVRLLRPGFITRSQIEQVVGDLVVGGILRAFRGPERCITPPPRLSRSCHRTTWSSSRRGRCAPGKVAVLAMRPPLHTVRFMTWINAGKKPTPMLTISTIICALWIEPVA